MNIELLRQFGQRLLAPHGGQSHLRFESRRVVPAWSSAHRLSCSAAILAAVRQKRHLSHLFKNPGPALYANRNYVERLWARLKEWRAIATRYEKTASSFMGVLCLAATLDWIKP